MLLLKHGSKDANYKFPIIKKFVDTELKSSVIGTDHPKLPIIAIDVPNS